MDWLGFHHFLTARSQRDIYILFASRFLRLFGFGAIVPILILHLKLLGIDDRLVGVFISLTLVGDVALSFIVTFIADKVGRRLMLAFGSFLMAISGVTFILCENYYLLLLGAVVGVISPSGNEVGPFAALEICILSEAVEPEARVFILMWYQIMGFFGTSLGSLATGIIVSLLTRHYAYSLITAYRCIFGVYAIVALVKAILSWTLSDHAEVDAPHIPPPIVADTSPSATERQPLLAPPTVDSPPPPLPLLRLSLLCLLFSLDSFASSLVPVSFISYYFESQFHASITTITRVFSAAGIFAGASQLAAGGLARKIGIVPTMVFTHMPAQLLTIGLAFAPNLASVLTLYLVRAMIASMDTAVRQAFLSAIIPKESRTRFLGIMNVSKTLASAPGGAFSGTLASLGGLRWSFVITGCVKLIYDVALWITFKTTKLEH